MTSADTPIPGSWICRRCGYRLQVRVIDLQSGNVGADERLTREMCPNGHGVLDQQVQGDQRAAPAPIPYAGTVWVYEHPASTEHPPRLDFVFVEAEPHDFLGQPTLYIKTRSVVGGKRERSHTTITTVAALRARYLEADVSAWPGELPPLLPESK